MDSCVSYLRFPVSHSMAPLSRLLIYYVRENGEGVTDSLQIPIQPDFENQVCIILKHKESFTASCCPVVHFTQKGFVMTYDLQIKYSNSFYTTVEKTWGKRLNLSREKCFITHLDIKLIISGGKFIAQEGMSLDIN